MYCCSCTFASQWLSACTMVIETRLAYLVKRVLISTNDKKFLAARILSAFYEKLYLQSPLKRLQFVLTPSLQYLKFYQVCKPENKD